MATEKTTKAAAKKAIKEIEEVQAPDAGIPEGKSLEELVADKYIAVLTEPLQDHTGPGHPGDYTFIPEFIRDDAGNERRITRRVKVMGHLRTISLDGNYFYRWCHPENFAKHRRRGFDFTNFEDFFGKNVTGYFQKTPEMRIRNGDVYLMQIGVEGLARMLREKMELQKHLEAAHEGELAKEAEDFNTKALRTFPDGSTENIN